MSAIRMRSRSGADGTIHLELPVGQPNTEFEVEVIVRPKDAPAGAWPPGYFDLFGSVQDDTFVRPPQGELPPAVNLE